MGWSQTCAFPATSVSQSLLCFENSISSHEVVLSLISVVFPFTCSYCSMQQFSSGVLKTLMVNCYLNTLSLIELVVTYCFPLFLNLFTILCTGGSCGLFNWITTVPSLIGLYLHLQVTLGRGWRPGSEMSWCQTWPSATSELFTPQLQLGMSEARRGCVIHVWLSLNLIAVSYWSFLKSGQ